MYQNTVAVDQSQARGPGSAAVYPYPYNQYGFQPNMYYPTTTYNPNGTQFRGGAPSIPPTARARFQQQQPSRGGFGNPGNFATSNFPQQFSGSRGGNVLYGRGGNRGRKKPFVGGTLESQRLWEQSTLCCFFLQGQCKFSEGCRFSHDDDGKRSCQFGAQCRVGHGSRTEGGQPPPAQ